MSDVRNAGVAGGVLLLMLWGGIGFFFGKGKGKGTGDGKSNASIERRVEPRDRTVDNRTNPPVDRRDQPVKAVSPSTKAPNTAGSSFTFVLRMTFIHPTLGDGKISEKTISSDELIELGRKAQLAKQELHLKVRGDARAQWLKQLQATLKQQNIPYSISNDF